MGKIETQPKKNVNTAEIQNSQHLCTPFPFNFMNANNPANHPTMHVRYTAPNMISVDKCVHTPKSIHKMKERTLVSSVILAIHVFEKLKYLCNNHPPK